MSSTESPTLTRSQLYELIWTTPRNRLAQQYGLSDVGLSKLCRRHDVPQPPRGYWAKLAVGKVPPRARLLHPERDPPIDLRALTAAESLRREKYQRDRDERKAWAERLEPVAVPERMNRPHPLVKATQAFFAAIPGQLKRDARRSDCLTTNPAKHRRPTTGATGASTAVHCPSRFRRRRSTAHCGSSTCS